MFVSADAVFMPSDAERLEYVLNDTGYLYVGSSEKIFAKPWNFGQVKIRIVSVLIQAPPLDVSRCCDTIPIS